MTNVNLTNEQWDKLCGFLKADPQAYVGNESACRLFVDAVIWIARSGAQWRLLPDK